MTATGYTTIWRDLSAEDHAIRQMDAAGLKLMVNSDDPAMFVSDLGNEYMRLHREMGLSLSTLKEMALNGIDASWIDDTTKVSCPGMVGGDRRPVRLRQRRLAVACASMTHRTPEELDAGLEHIRGAPSDRGELRLIVRRPDVDEREPIDEGVLDPDSGLVGDTWAPRGNPRTADGRADVLAQVTIMNSRVLDVIAGPVDRWPQAGDQLYADLDLSHDNLPTGTRLAVGEAQLEVTGVPHTGCGKFVQRFGLAAMRWVNSDTGMKLRLRGVNTRVVKPGAIRVGDRVTKADGASGYADWSGGEP